MGRTVINQTENKQTIILNDSPEGVEGGYFDNIMEWHEFGGGSGGIKNPKLTVNYVAPTSASSERAIAYIYENEIIYGKIAFINPHNGYVIETLVPAFDENGETIYGYNLPKFINYTQTASNEVNCQFSAFEGNYSVAITDPAQDASLTITVATA